MEAIFAGISGMSAAVARFGAATAAGFTISSEGGQALLDAIDKIVRQTDSAALTTERLAQEPPLGTTPAAQVYKPFLATVASDPVQGIQPALEQFKTDLELLRDQVQQAMGLYRTTDQNTERGVTAAGGPILSA